MNGMQMKNGIRGVCHQVSPEYLQYYLDDISANVFILDRVLQLSLV
jgi:hypothetical protein